MEGQSEGLTGQSLNNPRLFGWRGHEREKRCMAIHGSERLGKGPAGRSLNYPDYFMPMHGIARR